MAAHRVENACERRRTMDRSLQYILHVVIPLLIGGAIYIIWRSETLQMFRWLEFVDLDSPVNKLRDIYGGQNGQLPQWLLYSLPDAAWLYSFAMYMGLVWIDAKPRVVFSFMAIGPTLGLGGELGQGFRVVPGTFDLVDLIFLCVASILAALVVINQRIIR